jgi:glycosyltransferase involved in cell wall biosynthesis
VELSRLQRSRLRLAGVDETQCSLIPPPIECGPAAERGTIPAAAADWLSRWPEHCLLFAAAARVDAFKNLAAVVHAYIELCHAGVPVALYLAAGHDAHHGALRELRSLVPKSIAGQAWITPSMSEPDLLATFQAAAGRSVFAFPSRYETLGITPLQAMKSGVPVAFPAPPAKVGAAEYVATRFCYSAGGLTRKITELHRMNLAGEGASAARASVRSLSADRCCEVLHQILVSLRPV